MITVAVVTVTGATAAHAVDISRAGACDPRIDWTGPPVGAVDATERASGCGTVVYADPAPAAPRSLPARAAARARTAATPRAGTRARVDPFALASDPSADRTIYLDFTGFDVPAGNGWAAAVGGET